MTARDPMVLVLLFLYGLGCVCGFPTREAPAVTNLQMRVKALETTVDALEARESSNDSGVVRVAP